MTWPVKNSKQLLCGFFYYSWHYLAIAKVEGVPPMAGLPGCRCHSVYTVRITLSGGMRYNEQKNLHC